MTDEPKAEPIRQIDAHDLRNYLDQFILQNARSRDVEHRWLAAYAVDLMKQAYNVKVGNHDTIKPMVKQFRLDEIDKARADLVKQTAALEAEAARIFNEQAAEPLA